MATIDPEEAAGLVESIRWDRRLLDDPDITDEEYLTIGDGIEQMLTEVQFG